MTDQLSDVFLALADPTRRGMLERLSQGEATVKQLAEPFDISGPAITKHLKILERAGLITRGKEAQYRPCKLEMAPLVNANAWIEQYRQLWERQFDQLEAYLKELQDTSAKYAALPTKSDSPNH